MFNARFSLFGALAGALAVLTACGGGGSSPPVSSPPLPTASAPAPTPLQHLHHVVIVIQENRSFDNLFNGYPGADTVQSASLPDGSQVPLHRIGLEDGIDVDHTHRGFEQEYDGGKNDGYPGITTTAPTPPNYAYAYVDPAETAIYRTLASRFVLADRMFQSNSGPSFTAHQYLIAGQSADVAEVPSQAPWGCDAPAGTTTTVLDPHGMETTGPFPCETYPTLGDELDSAGVSWGYYTPTVADEGGLLWSAYDAVGHIRYGTDWADVHTPETTIFSDIAAGRLPQVSWIVPTISNSDHPQGNSSSGPQWVGSVVDALGTSRYWNDTAVIVLWDDWGGWYDHVVPQQLDVMGLGYRVPLLAISPYAKHGYVSHVQHEFGSVLRFVEETFGLPSLFQVDARADDLSDCFDFTQAPAPYATVTSSGMRRTMSVPKPSAFMDY